MRTTEENVHVIGFQTNIPKWISATLSLLDDGPFLALVTDVDTAKS